MSFSVLYTAQNTQLVQPPLDQLIGELNAAFPTGGAGGGGGGAIIGSFAAYTPTVTAGSGTFTSVSATGRWCQIGKLVFFTAEVTITTNGSAASSVNFTLPTTANSDTVFAGREVNITQNALTSVVASGSNVAMTVSYSGTYPGANGYKDLISGCYETQ